MFGSALNCAEHYARARTVVGDRVLQPDTPVDDARIDDLEAHADVLRCGQHVGDADVGPLQFAPQHESRLDFDLRVDERTEIERHALVVQHRVEQMAVVGLVDAEHLLHRPGREPDLVADDVFAALEPPLHVRLLDPVRLGHRELRKPAGQRLNRPPARLRAVQHRRALGNEVRSARIRGHASPVIVSFFR